MESVTRYYCDYCLAILKTETGAVQHVSRRHNGYGNWRTVQLEVPVYLTSPYNGMTKQCQCGDKISLHLHHRNNKTNKIVWYCSLAEDIFEEPLH